jgi:putative Holliday junction resolvase
MAKQAMIEMGMKKKARRNKRIVDEIAATIMLQEYLTAAFPNLSEGEENQRT